MIKFNRQKFFIALVCVFVGWSIGFYMGKKKTEENLARYHRVDDLSHLFGIPFPNDPDHEKSPSILDRFFKKWFHNESQENRLSASPSDSFFNHSLSFFGLKNAQLNISTREDENFIYMDIDLTSFDKDSLSAKVENDTLVIEGIQKSEDSNSSTSSHFYQSFPVPEGTDASKVDMFYEDHKLILKFPKLTR